MCFYFLFFINECEGTECDFLVLILAANLWTVAAGGRFSRRGATSNNFNIHYIAKVLGHTPSNEQV